MTRFQPRRIVSLSVAVVAGLVVGGGCNRSANPYYPARGQVLVGGKAAEGALVTLVPSSGSSDPSLKPSGRVGADGWFTLTTYEAATRTVHQGALPGQYVAVITWVPDPTRESLSRPGTDPDRLGGKYKDPKTSHLTVEVGEGVTDLPPITIREADVKGRKP